MGLTVLSSKALSVGTPECRLGRYMYPAARQCPDRVSYRVHHREATFILKTRVVMTPLRSDLLKGHQAYRRSLLQVGPTACRIRSNTSHIRLINNRSYLRLASIESVSCMRKDSFVQFMLYTVPNSTFGRTLRVGRLQKKTNFVILGKCL